MPIQIDSVINEISPATNNSGGEEGADNRWQKSQAMEANHDEFKTLVMRVSAEDFDD